MTTNATTPTIRVSTQDGHLWFCAADLASAFGLTNASLWTRPLPAADRKSLTTRTKGAPVHMTAVSYAGLLKLLFAAKSASGRTAGKRLTTGDILSGDPVRILHGFKIEPWDGTPRHLQGPRDGSRRTHNAV